MTSCEQQFLQHLPHAYGHPSPTHHAAPERDAPGRTLHREARAARRPPSTRSVTRAGLLHSLHAGCAAALPVLNIQPACSALRPCAASRLTRRRSCTARGARVARCARAPPSVQSAVQSACTQHRASTCMKAHVHAHVHVHAAQSPHSDAARTPRQSPASRRPRLPHAVLCALYYPRYFFFATKRKQKLKTKTSPRLLEQRAPVGPERPAPGGKCV